MGSWRGAITHPPTALDPGPPARGGDGYPAFHNNPHSLESTGSGEGLYWTITSPFDPMISLATLASLGLWLRSKH